MTQKERFIKAAQLAAVWEEFRAKPASISNQLDYDVVLKTVDKEVYDTYIAIYEDTLHLDNSFPEAPSMLMSEAFA